MPPNGVKRIVSGGQTGVDQAALQAAINLNIPHGGWCPKGRRSEDGPIPPRFLLSETHSTKYWVRTEKNVQDSDATLILYRHQVSGGTALTKRLAVKHDRPYLAVDLMSPKSAGESALFGDVNSGQRWPNSIARVRHWLVDTGAQCLNIAGPRESGEPGIFDEAYQFVSDIFLES